MTREKACKLLHDTAIKELGVHETPGPESTARIVEYEKHTNRGYTGSDEDPWCAKFANFVCDTTGYHGTHSAAARSWLKWGVPLEVPILGCIVVFDRRDVHNPNAAHVAICDHPDISNGIIRVIGGNQGSEGSVSVSRFPTLKVLGYRSPL